MSELLPVLICSYLEEPLVEVIGATPGVEVLNAPELLPVPRYPCDHTGPRPDLAEGALARWGELLGRAEVCFDFDWDAPARLPERAPRLRWIQATSAGIGGFMTRTGLSRSSITVSTAAGVHVAPLSEWVITGVLHFVKDIPLLQARQRDHRWQRVAVGALAGRRALVVGLGNVGRRVVETLAGLGVEVWGAGRPGGRYDVPRAMRLGSTDELAEMLPAADILVLSCPLTPETEGMIGRSELALLPERAIVVNIGRGQLVDEDAMIEALVAGRLGAAVLDVARVEPLPEDSPLWELDNVLICPHSASTFATENATLVELFLDNLQRFRAGAPLRNVYRADRGY
jgi:phosphoglycerate dehydrogenase-like enzyme